MDPKDEETLSSSSSSSGDSPSPAVHENGTADEPITQGQAKEKEVVKESSGEAALNGEAKVTAKIEDLSDDDEEDYKSCEGELDEERGEEKGKEAKEKEGEGPGEKPHPPKSQSEERDGTEHRRHPRDQKWSEALKAKLFASVDKDSNYFSYMFLDKIFGEARPCKFCGARGTAKLPPGDESLKLFVLEDGLIGKQNILCSVCGKIDTVISDDDGSRLPSDDRLSITGTDIRFYCRNVTHYEILHDLMEMLHIAATDDDSQRQEKHHEVADFMLKNVRKVCEEWCRPEYAELRLKKYLRLRDETLLTTYNPTFTPDCTEEYKEMYEMMANSFRQNRDKVLLLLQLMKESLIDSPTRSTFMMWVSIAMMHSESYSQFKTAYDPRSFMRVDSSEYQALQDRYLALEVPLGIKKIPVIFILFEIPRFYHYVEFLNQRIGKKKSRNYLTEEERDMLQNIEEESLKMGLKMKPRTGKMVSPEAHLDFLTRQEEYEREMIYQSCRDKEKAKQQKLHNALKEATSVKGGKRAALTSGSGDTSPSTNKKTESSKSLSSSSKDSNAQTNSSTSKSASTATSSSSYAERERQCYLGPEIQKPVANKKKRRKAKQDKLAEAEAALSVEEKARRKAIEDAARKKREEFISHDAFHAILRETLEASEASKNVVIQEEEPEEDKQKQRLRRILKKREEEREREQAMKEERSWRKEDRLRKETEKGAKSEKKPSKGEEKKASKREERKPVKEEKKSAKVEQKVPLKEDSLPKMEKARIATDGEDKKDSNGEKKTPLKDEVKKPSKDEGKKVSKDEVKKVSKGEEKKLLQDDKVETAAKEETKGKEKETETVAREEKEKGDVDGGEKKKEKEGEGGKNSNENESATGSGGKPEKPKNELDDGTQIPKVIKPEVNPESPLANISLPPRLGADPNRKPINLPDMEPTNTPASKYTTRSTLKRELREQVKATRRHKKSGKDSKTVLCAQVDTEMLRAQGYKISGNSPVTTVVANSDGTIEHILEGLNTPEQVKSFLSKRYSILNQQAGSGHLTRPSKGDPGAIVMDDEAETNPYLNPGATAKALEEPKQHGNPKKRKKVRAAQQDTTISSLMDCYAAQRQQSRPGGWRVDLEPLPQRRMAPLPIGGEPPKVLNEAMCDVLGGGSLTKALSTAYKGVMSQVEYQKEKDAMYVDNEAEAYEMAPDGASSLFDIADKRETTPTSDGDKPTNPSESSETSSDKTGSEKSGSGQNNNTGNETGGDDSGSGNNTGSGSGSGTGSGSGSNAGDKDGDDHKKGGGGDKKNKSKDEKLKSGSKKDSKSHDKSGKSRDKSGHGSSTAVSRIDDESRWICRMGNESTIIHTDEVREVVISRGEELITLKPIGKAHMSNWSIGKKELFRKHQCKGLDEKIYHVNNDAEAKLVFQEAMKPCDLGPLEGPCPRYVVPSSGGKIRFPDYFEDMSDIEDLADYIHSHAAPRQQMALMDAMSFPYKLETTKVFMPRRDRDGNELPGGGMKCAIVSKITMLPKELAHKKVEVLDHGLLLQLIDSDDEEAELLRELEAPPKRKEIEPPPKRKEIEAPPPKRKEIEPPPPPAPKKNEPSAKNTISTADLDLDDSKTDMAVDTLTRLVAHTLATKTRLKDVPISMDNLSDTIMDVLKDMSTADLLAHINDEELGITLPARESGVKPSRRKTNNRSGKELREKLAAKHSANKLAKEREAALASYNSVSDTTGSGSITAQSRRKKVKKKPPKKIVENQTSFEESSHSAELTEKAPDPGSLAADETPISMNGQELGGVAKTPEPEPEPVRDIDDIDDIDVGVSEELLKGGGTGGVVSSGHASSSVTTATTGGDLAPARTSQSKVVAAREKFRFCENCGLEIEDKILVCSSCKKVAYCNRQCQKAHWKSHKKTCSHKVSKEDCTG